MRRFFTLAVLLLFTVPFGVSISGCSKKTPVTYCSGDDSGVQVGQTVQLTLSPQLSGISINQGAIGSIGAPSGKDCRGNTSSTAGTVYASSNMNLVDINPSTGSGGLCAGTWNRNSGAGIANYTICTPNGGEGVAYITASAQGVTSNPVAVYVHPVITSINLVPPTNDCVTTANQASNCYNVNVQAACGASPSPVAAAPFTGKSCISQNSSAQLAAQVFDASGTNISCLVGPLTFNAANSSVVTIDTNGVATAAQPGSTLITAATSQASSTAGFFSTCPPASIVLTVAGQTTPPTAPVATDQNVPKEFTATVTDIHGVALTNIPLTYISTDPVTIPTSSNVVTPSYPGSAAITAVCQPPTCNTAPYDLIGLYGNGTPITSLPVDINATGTGNSTILYIASTDSQYILPYDFNVTTQASPTRLPYAPNSLVLSEDGTTIYMGTPNELMVYSTNTNSLTKQDPTVNGLVLAASPNNTDLVITDPVRKLTYIYAVASGVITEYGGVATTAKFSNDSTTVYITTNDQRLLVYSTYTGWTAQALATPVNGVAPTVPNAGVYLAGNPIEVQTNCPNTTIVNPNTGIDQTTTNQFYPPVGAVAVDAANPVIPGSSTTGYSIPGSSTSYFFPTNNIASTNDGLHEIAASPAALTDIGTNRKSGACPVAFSSTPGTPIPFTVASPTSITNLLPTSDSDYVFVAYYGTGGVVPEYNLTAATPTLSNIALQTLANNPAPIAPEAGVVSSDNNTFFVGTSGDNLVHQLTRGANGFSDTTAPLIPALPSFTGSGFATPNLLAQKPIKANS
jgi:hypothetical protein